MATLEFKLEGDVGGDAKIIDKDIIIGRYGDIKTPSGLTCISRLHFAIFTHSDGYYIRDLNSHCGTKVNGKDIGKASVKLNDGDEIVIGIDARPKMIFKFIK